MSALLLSRLVTFEEKKTLLSFISLVGTRFDLTSSSLALARPGTGPQNAAANGAAGGRAQAQASAPPDEDNRFRNDREVRNILREAGVHPSMAITPEDLDLANRTPHVTARSFNILFGGNPYHERPRSKWNILCVNRDTQPYAPHSPGQSGLVFIHPDVALFEDTCETFHLFVNMNPKLSRSDKQVRYLGTYTKVPNCPCNR